MGIFPYCSTWLESSFVNIEILADACCIASSKDTPKYLLFSSTRGLCCKNESLCCLILELFSDWLNEFERTLFKLFVDLDLWCSIGLKNSWCECGLCTWVWLLFIDFVGDLDSTGNASLSEGTSLTLSLDIRLPRFKFLTHPKIEFLLVGDREWLILLNSDYSTNALTIFACKLLMSITNGQNHQILAFFFANTLYKDTFNVSVSTIIVVT